MVFQEYNVLDYSTLSISNSSEYPLVAVALELPSNITDAVLNVYGAYTLSSVFINPPELYGHRAAGTHALIHNDTVDGDMGLPSCVHNVYLYFLSYYVLLLCHRNVCCLETCFSPDWIVFTL